jgi:hypothetical protein
MAGRPRGAAGTRRAPPAAPPSPDQSEAAMSGSSGNTSAGSKGGRSPRGGDPTITERHHQGLPEGAQKANAADAARPTRTGEQDSDRQDPDDPQPDEAA